MTYPTLYDIDEFDTSNVTRIVILSFYILGLAAGIMSYFNIHIF
jgi:hypothetical protein